MCVDITYSRPVVIRSSHMLLTSTYPRIKSTFHLHRDWFLQFTAVQNRSRTTSQPAKGVAMTIVE